MKTTLAALVRCLIGVALAGAALRGPAAEPFHFIQLTDPQFGMFTSNADFAQETANLEFAVATVNRLRPAFVIVTGDLVNRPGDSAQIAEYRRIMGKVDPAIPVYHVAGNHDVGNTPTNDVVAKYEATFGRDHYVIRHGNLVGFVLNSCVIHTPEQVTERMEAQERWLREELAKARAAGARHLVVFAHHPWFLKAADEPDQYFNVPRERRARYLALFREHGVRYLFSGHYHRNAVARDGGFEAVTTGPVGKPLGGDRSGLRLVIVREEGLDHAYHDFSQLPNRVELVPPAPAAKRKEAR